MSSAFSKFLNDKKSCFVPQNETSLFENSITCVIDSGISCHLSMHKTTIGNRQFPVSVEPQKRPSEPSVHFPESSSPPAEPSVQFGEPSSSVEPIPQTKSNKIFRLSTSSPAKGLLKTKNFFSLSNAAASIVRRISPVDIYFKPLSKILEMPQSFTTPSFSRFCIFAGRGSFFNNFLFSVS